MGEICQRSFPGFGLNQTKPPLPTPESSESMPDNQRLALHDFEPSTETFLEDVLTGLAREPKRLSSKYFYDERGSALFDEICELDEYYLTRTELAIMREHAGAMAERIGPQAMLIEYGSGSGIKTRLLLDVLPSPACYVPVDISREHMAQSAAELNQLYPELEVLPVCADFTEPFDLPRCQASPRRQVVYFPGSTLGNFSPSAARQLLASMVKLVGPGGGLLLGIDLQKEPALLEAAYNDSLGITAEFNRNLLRRIRNELGGELDLEGFQHTSFYNSAAGRIESYLESRREQTIRLDGQEFTLAAGERIGTEYSHKYDLDQFRQVAAEVGLQYEEVWTDPRRWFAVLLLKVAPE